MQFSDRLPTWFIVLTDRHEERSESEFTWRIFSQLGILDMMLASFMVYEALVNVVTYFGICKRREIYLTK